MPAVGRCSTRSSPAAPPSTVAPRTTCRARARTSSSSGSLEPTDAVRARRRGTDRRPGHLQGLRVPELLERGELHQGRDLHVDITNPRRPVETGVHPGPVENYHGEGAHVISASTRDFEGDLLAVNNETCADRRTSAAASTSTTCRTRANPKTLVQGAGDFGGEGQMTGQGTKAQRVPQRLHVAGRRQGLPRRHRQHGVPRRRHLRHLATRAARSRSREYDMLELFPQIAETPPPNGNEVFNHDMVVKEIGGRDVMLDSYWDARLSARRHREPGEARLHRRRRLLDGKTDPLTGERAARGQRPPGGVLGRQPVPPGGRRGLQPVQG